MASKRKYGYYIKGNKIAIIEEGTGSGICSLSGYSSQTTCESAGGTWTENAVSTNDGEYRSPVATVADGLEIQYSYMSNYIVTDPATVQENKFYLNGWTVKDGYLMFLRSHSASVPSWDASPYSDVGDDEYILISGSERWNGLHKVKSGGTNGTLQTYTRVNKSVAIVEGSSNIDIYGEGTGGASATQTRIIANDSSNIWLNAIFNTNDYIFVVDSAVAKNNGFWQVSGVQDNSSAESSSGIYVTNRYFCYDGDNTLSTEGEDTSPDTTLATDESVDIYRAYRDFCYLESDIEVMDDESFELDLPRYQANALVYYLKARMAEDASNLELREFFMREFKRQLEKSNSAKQRGPYIVQGLKELR